MAYSVVSPSVFGKLFSLNYINNYIKPVQPYVSLSDVYKDIDVVIKIKDKTTNEGVINNSISDIIG